MRKSVERERLRELVRRKAIEKDDMSLEFFTLNKREKVRERVRKREKG